MAAEIENALREDVSPNYLVHAIAESLRRIMVARRQHGAAVGDGPARSAELTKAEAQLDAELIRLRAYTEALAVVLAAHGADDLRSAADVSAEPLGQIISLLREDFG